MRTIILLLLILSTTLVLGAEEFPEDQGVLLEGPYAGLEYEVTNIGIDTDEDGNVTTETTTREVKIKQPDYEPSLNTDGYEVFDEEKVIREFQADKAKEVRAERAEILAKPIIEETNNIVEEDKTSFWLLLIKIFGSVFCILLFVYVLTRLGKKKKHRTPEEIAKQLLDAGHEEAYVEKVYAQLKEEQQGGK